MRLILFSFFAMMIIIFAFLGKVMPDFSSKMEEIQKYLSIYSSQNFQQKIWAPKALVSEEKNPQSFLTKQGIIDWTNKFRQEKGLSPLKENAKLSESALAKAKDMFEKQYFEHDSPEGIGVADLAKKAGYQFLVVGENLALGDFANDQALVIGWMESPGHRANILNKNFNEIGVAVVKGDFKGIKTWIAVQHFGVPVEKCPIISEEKKEKIEENRNQIIVLENEINLLKKEINEFRKKDKILYSQKVDEYNNLVSKYNTLVLETKKLIEEYNLQIELFNKCVASLN